MSEKFIIYGGKHPKGVIEVRGAKNVAFPVLAATLLTKQVCLIDNLPLIEDVFRMLEILEKLGAQISWLDKRKIKIRCSEINPSKIPFEIINLFRGSILTAGPLLARFNKIKITPPGGCLIGARPLDTHFDAFSQLGNKISLVKNKFYSFEKKSRPSPEVILKEFSVTATENVLLFSALSSQKTVIKIADQDYQVQELAKVLRQMGVKIRGIGTHTLEIVGQKKLKGFKYSIISDPIETGTFIALSLANSGNILVKKANLSFLDLFLKRLKDFGAEFEILDNNSIRVFPSKGLKMDKVQSLPYPGIHTDLQPELGVLATQAEGPTLIHDPLYEGRLRYLEELNKMGASIIFCDPHRAIINGPTPLFGIRIQTTDLRAGAASVIAGLIARGETVIENVYQIDRGYEKIDERLQKLGLDIKRVKA